MLIIENITPDDNGHAEVTIKLPKDVKVGDTLIINDVEKTLDEADIKKGEVTTKVEVPEKTDIKKGEVTTKVEVPEKTVTVTIEDKAGNTSEPITAPTTIPEPKDTTAPDKPTDVIIDNKDGYINENKKSLKMTLIKKKLSLKYQHQKRVKN